MNTHRDVALFLWNSDIIEMMSWLLLDRHVDSDGVEPSEGYDAIAELILHWTPKVVVFDLMPPYQASSEELARLVKRFPNASFVITCADSTLAQKRASWLSAFPVFEKPYDPFALAHVIHDMVTLCDKSYKSVTAMSIGA
jgi:hypothetical protein